MPEVRGGWGWLVGQGFFRLSHVEAVGRGVKGWGWLVGQGFFRLSHVEAVGRGVK
jgi:hypothetical protein